MEYRHYQEQATGRVESLEAWRADGVDAANLDGYVGVRRDKAGGWVAVPFYCSQNGGDCLSCALVNDDWDCRKSPL